MSEEKRRAVRILRSIVIVSWTALLAPVIAFHFLNCLFPFPKERIAAALAAPSQMVFSSDGGLVSWRVDGNENWRLPTTLDAVSPHLVDATVAVEDRNFFRHLGVDPAAAARALAQNIYYRKRISGASTITMQTVRLLWQRPRRLSSKLTEAFRALQLERILDKKSILELYFNLAPYGGNIVGVEAASRRYFGKSASALSLGEASLLAGLPQSPVRYDPRRNPEAAQKRRWQVLDRMLDEGRIDLQQATRAGKEEVQLENIRSRRELTHFADWVAQARPGTGGSVVTRLDSDWQRRVRHLARRREDEWKGRGLAGPAVIVLDVADSSVKAYLGNGGDRGAPGWQMDALRARRQPGSLLKPFIFAALADEGKITPSSRVYDLPAFWLGYAPQNMDREWTGDTTAAKALRQSRNIPALRQLALLGVDNFGNLLTRLHLDPGTPSRQGLSMALGAREQRLVDLVNAYAALARLGEWRPLRLFADADGEAPGRAHRVFSPEAAWLTLAALSPAGSGVPSVAWKTGTSWNRRDAWAIALSPRLAVGVWCGRLRGPGDSVGAEDALPLALDVLAALDSDAARTAWPRPEGVDFAEVCVHSGLEPGWSCPETVSSPVILAGTASPVCRLPHASVAASPTDSGAAGAPSLQITSPAPGACYVVGNADSGNLLQFAAANSSGPLFWFVNGCLAGSTGPGEKLSWPLRPGSHRVVAADASGHAAGVAFSVMELEDGLAAK